MSWLLAGAPCLLFLFCLCKINGPSSRTEQVEDDRRAYLKAQEGRTS